MLIDNVEEFSCWLVEELKGLCEADPITLSKYVIALLKKDKSEVSLRKICSEQLYVFLVEKTNNFVDKVFEFLKPKVALSISKIEEIVCARSSEDDLPKLEETIIDDMMDDSIVADNVEDNFSKENISFDPLPDFKNFSAQDNKSNKDRFELIREKKDIDSRYYSKRSLDHSDHKTVDEERKKRRYNDDVDLRDRRRHSSRHRSHKSKRHVTDRIDQSHKSYDKNDGYRSNVTKASCPDFVEKGVCLKGYSCEFDHGNIVVGSEIGCIYSAPEMNRNITNTNWPPLSMNQNWVDNYVIPKPNTNLVPLKNVDDKTYQPERRQSRFGKDVCQNTDIYDPSHPEIDAINDSDSRNGLTDQAPVYVPSKVESTPNTGSWPCEDEPCSNNLSEGSQVTTVIGSAQSRYRRAISPVKRMRQNNTGNNNNYNNYGNNNNYNSGNNNNNNNSNNFNKRTANARCLLVTHIPYDCNDEFKLRQHFKAFGTVTDVEVRFQNDSQHALIEFSSVEQAKTAFRSPLPILDNRFIRTSLFSRPGDTHNLRVCKDVDEKSEWRDRRTVKRDSAPKIEKDNGSGDDVADKWPSDDERAVVVNEEQKRPEKKVDNWPVASELKLDRRTVSVVGNVNIITKDGIINQDSAIKPRAFKLDERNPKLLEAQIERQNKIKAINDRKELKARIEKLEDSVQSCKNRLKSLLLEQKNPDCDKDLVKRQLLESYNYFKELREVLEPLKKKLGPQPQLSEIDKLKLKIKNTQAQLADMDRESDPYKKLLRTITESKRDLIKLQTVTKGSRPNRLPSLFETKLDNRPKTLYVTGLYPHSTIGDVRQQFKKYQIEKVDTSDNDMAFFAVELKTRKEADRLVFEMTKPLADKNVTLSFEKPIQICDPLDFKTRSDHADTLRGTPRDNCASSDEEDESKTD